MLLQHPDGYLEQIDVDEMRPFRNGWMVAIDELLGVGWVYPQPPVCDPETGHLIAAMCALGRDLSGDW